MGTSRVGDRAYRHWAVGLATLCTTIGLASVGLAQETAPPPVIDSGDTAWVLTSSALV
jgi:hypothetical protein